jgi:hypothetical protein
LPTTAAPLDLTPSPIQLRDVTDRSQVKFIQTSGNSKDKHFPTANGSGVAFLDYDRDGLIDLYFSSTRNLPLSAPNTSRGNRLYRNLGDGTFEDVTAIAGVAFNGFNHCPAAGDVNGDGWPDLLLTNFGPNVLLLNNGDGTFRDASTGSGLTEIPWSSGAAFFDFDNDGHQDIYISCYGIWTEAGEHTFCGVPGRVRTYCSPNTITPARHYLFHNRGDATFEDVTTQAGILRTDGRGMGITAVDIDRDGWIDLFVANDLSPNFLFLNKHDGTFEDIGELSGAACAENGQNQAGMGTDAMDVDGDGLPELVVTHFSSEYTTMYHNIDGKFFQDVSAAAGVVKNSLPDVGWGCSLDDLDNDGRPDLLVANGHVDDNLPEFNGGPSQQERAKIWRNVGSGKFVFQPNPGPYFLTENVVRGAGFGDLDGDGRIDVVLVRLDAPAVMLRNESAPKAWIGLDLVGRGSNRDAIGSDVEVHVPGAVLYRQVRGGRSYQSTPDRRLTIGLGDASRVDEIVIRWPRGAVTRLTAPQLGIMHVLREPAAAPASAQGTDR